MSGAGSQPDLLKVLRERFAPNVDRATDESLSEAIICEVAQSLAAWFAAAESPSCDIASKLEAWSHDERLGDGMLVRRAAQTIRGLQRQLAYVRGTALPHAQSQAHADGFQAGWRAVLQRLHEGDTASELQTLLPSNALEASAPVPPTQDEWRSGRNETEAPVMQVATPAARQEPTPEPLTEASTPLLDRVEATIANEPGYSILRGWLALHGGASARIALEEMTQLVRALSRSSARPTRQAETPQDAADYLRRLADWYHAEVRRVSELVKESI